MRKRCATEINPVTGGVDSTREALDNFVTKQIHRLAEIGLQN